MRLIVTALTVFACVLAGIVSAPAAVAAAGVSATTVALHRCDLGTVRPARCGSIRVPLDYTDSRSPEITIGFGLIAGDTPTGTVVAQEGGPGYPSTGTAPDFEAMLGPLLKTRDLLVVDARGTGRSTPIDCRPLQPMSPRSTRFEAAVAACGRQLNHTWHRRGGGWVHASDLFTTANSARDLAAVLTALHRTRIDLYGDSYGTYFSQAFLARYPHLLRSVILDSAYEARDLDPWYRTTVTTARTALNAVCRRAIGCPAGDPWHRLTRLVTQVRAHPLHGVAPGTDGRRHHVTVDVTALVNVVNDAGYDIDVDRQLDAAVRAELDHHDALPLLRLWLQDIGVDESAEPATDNSGGLYLAVACTDYPQLFDPRSPHSTRVGQLNTAIRHLPAGTFAPFTTREWIRVEAYTEAYTACLSWPHPTHHTDPPVPTGVPMDPDGVPVLILNGDLDSLTPAAGGDHIASQIGPAATHLIAVNTVHLVALDVPTTCAPHLVQRFITNPRGPLHPECLAHIPAVRAVPDYPRTLHDEQPATGPGPRTTATAIAVAVQEAGDALTRTTLTTGNTDQALRGGSVTARGRTTRLYGARLTTDAAVTGTLHTTATGAHGLLRIRAPHRLNIRIHVTWGTGRYATATINGTRYTTPAP